MAARRFWLFKSEPESFAFADLLRAPKRRTCWDGVRNYQARNLLRDQVQVGDGVLFYHSSTDPLGVAGVAKVVRSGYPDDTAFDSKSDHFDPDSDRKEPTWFMVDIEAVAACEPFVTRELMAGDAALSDMMVLRRGARLSIQPVAPGEWRRVLELGGAQER